MQSLVLYDYILLRFIFSLIRRPLAPGDEADLLYTQCSLMPRFLSEKPMKGSGPHAANIDQNMYLSVVFYSTQCITTTQYMILILHVASSMEHYAHLEYKINTHKSLLTFHTLCD